MNKKIPKSIKSRVNKSKTGTFFCKFQWSKKRKGKVVKRRVKQGIIKWKSRTQKHIPEIEISFEKRQNGMAY